MKKSLFLILPVALLASTPALAHLNTLEHGSFATGFFHPFFGLDHILVMVAVGLWAVSLGGRSLWLVPTAFVATMVAGFFLALSGVSLPFVEPAILASVVVIGLFATVALKVPTPVAMILAGVFALFHGHAHGGELGSAGALTYGMGFVLATVLLHAVGIGMGAVFGERAGRMIIRVAGAGTAVAGLWLAFGV